MSYYTDEDKQTLIAFIQRGLRGKGTINKWFEYPFMVIYIRVSTRSFSGKKYQKFLDIANIHVNETNQNVGVWTEYRLMLEAVSDELKIPLFVENCINRHLRESLISHGYRRVDLTEVISDVLCFVRDPK